MAATRSQSIQRNRAETAEGATSGQSRPTSLDNGGFQWSPSTASPTAPASVGTTRALGECSPGRLTIERIGPVTEQGNLVFWPIHVANAYDVSGSEVVAVMYLREGRIAQHWVIWSE
jgi:hypothetical protein